ncbi:trypsin-like peptidase domain-containing protein [Nonomuraea sp. NPDC049129]|uniref:trypsin-like peptidase domain-containing protein n=1 Tax=Nonomuraea sp. NPDC049129 TaxID=3155272 RepID=UPI0033DF7289
MMRWLWLPILLVLSGCSITVPFWLLPTASPPHAGDVVIPPEIVSEKQSVVRVSGPAPSCGKKIEGTGFVYAPQRVVTAAHVVAGVVESLVVTADEGEGYQARVVAFDPDIDVAVLYVPDLSAPALHIAETLSEAPLGDAYLLGYRKDTEHAVVEPIRVDRRVEAESMDIYHKHQVTRTVLTLSADMRSGMIGAPLVLPGATVSGMTFAAAVDHPDRGFALAAKELLPITDAASDATRRVSTQQCDVDRPTSASSA